MAGSGNGNEHNPTDFNSPQTRAVNMHEPSNADPRIAIADESFNATERLYQEPQRHGWKLHAKIIEHRYQLAARIHGVSKRRLKEKTACSGHHLFARGHRRAQAGNS